jgi:hypothetical protein
MNELLSLAVEAHGGSRRWEEKSWFSATASITGAIWELKGKPGLLADVVLEGETRDQRLKITPFPWPGRYAAWEPYRQTIETSEGLLVAQRREPATSFADLTRQSTWDDLQVACFAGEAAWNYFVAPFIFTRPDFTVDETLLCRAFHLHPPGLHGGRDGALERGRGGVAAPRHHLPGLNRGLRATTDVLL